MVIGLRANHTKQTCAGARSHRTHVAGDRVKDKFSYFDVLAYFAPGLVALWSAQQSLRFVGLSTYFQMENWAFESLVGIIFAYVLGQLVSARARMRFESKTLKHRMPVFRDGLISENFLLKDRSVNGQILCTDRRREMLIETAVTFCGLSTRDAEKLDTWEGQLEAAQEISHRIYRPLLTLLADEEIGVKAHTMNLRYVLFRNLNVASAYGAFLFAIAAVYNFLKHVSFADARIILPALLALLFASTSAISRREAVHTAINHVREVFDSAHHYYSSRSHPARI